MNNKFWRDRIGKRREKNELDWRVGLYKEFIQFVEETSKLAEIYDWDFWGGGTDNFAVTLSQAKRSGKSISLKMIPSAKYSYYVSFAHEWNPNNISDSEYKEFVSESMLDVIKYLRKFLTDNSYVREYRSGSNIILGNGYDKCFMRIRWAKEELVDNMIEEEFIN
ncbi:MAG: hypothetical protein IJY25_00455 [Bacilli bacterium]|nr:hypothetical protein [Bacilli bacterium]